MDRLQTLNLFINTMELRLHLLPQDTASAHLLSLCPNLTQLGIQEHNFTAACLSHLRRLSTFRAIVGQPGKLIHDLVHLALPQLRDVYIDSRAEMLDLADLRGRASLGKWKTCKIMHGVAGIFAREVIESSFAEGLSLAHIVSVAS